MEEILAGIVCMLLVFALFPLLLWKRRQTSGSAHEHQDEHQPLVVISISNLKLGSLFVSSWLIAYHHYSLWEISVTKNEFFFLPKNPQFKWIRSKLRLVLKLELISLLLVAANVIS